MLPTVEPDWLSSSREGARIVNDETSHTQNIMGLIASAPWREAVTYRETCSCQAG